MRTGAVQLGLLINPTSGQITFRFAIPFRQSSEVKRGKNNLKVVEVVKVAVLFALVLFW